MMRWSFLIFKISVNKIKPGELKTAKSLPQSILRRSVDFLLLYDEF